MQEHVEAPPGLDHSRPVKVADGGANDHFPARLVAAPSGRNSSATPRDLDPNSRARSVIRLQRAVGNGAAVQVLQRTVQRDVGPASPPVTFQIAEELPEKSFKYFKVKPAIKGSIQFQAIAAGKQAPDTGPGVGADLGSGKLQAKMETELAKWSGDLVKGIGLDEVDSKLSAEAGEKGLDVAITVGCKAKTGIPGLSGVGEGQLSLATIDFENPDELKVLTAEFTSGISGTTKARLGGVDGVMTVKIAGGAAIEPNWATILAEIGKRYGPTVLRRLITTGGRAAGQVLAAIGAAELGMIGIAALAVAGFVEDMEHTGDMWRVSQAGADAANGYVAGFLAGLGMEGGAPPSSAAGAAWSVKGHVNAITGLHKQAEKVRAHPLFAQFGFTNDQLIPGMMRMAQQRREQVLEMLAPARTRIMVLYVQHWREQVDKDNADAWFLFKRSKRKLDTHESYVRARMGLPPYGELPSAFEGEAVGTGL